MRLYDSKQKANNVDTLYIKYIKFYLSMWFFHEKYRTKFKYPEIQITKYLHIIFPFIFKKNNDDMTDPPTNQCSEGSF